MSELYRDYIDGKADEIINSLGGTITPAPANAELYRDFLDRKFDDVINAIDNVKVKVYSYKGTSTSSTSYDKTIVLPDEAKIILNITGICTISGSRRLTFTDYFLNVINPQSYFSFFYVSSAGTSSRVYSEFQIIDNKTIKISGNSAINAFDYLDGEYTVYYI